MARIVVMGAGLGGMSAAYELRETLGKGHEIVLVGNGEIVHRLARPDNRAIYSMLGAIWTLPKLTDAWRKALTDENATFCE